MTQQRTWTETAESLTAQSLNPFTVFSSVLTAISVSAADALQYSVLDFGGLYTVYTNAQLISVAAMVYAKNKKKYDMLLDVYNAEYDPIANVDANETYTDTRTPDITRTTSTEASSTGSIKNNQIKTNTEIPDDYKSTTTTFKDPYDNTGFTTDSKAETVDTGSRSTTEEYSGEPDETTSTGTSSSTNTETGTETIVHELVRHGNIGVTSTQQLITQQIDLAPKLDILNIILSDFCDAALIGVWG